MRKSQHQSFKFFLTIMLVVKMMFEPSCNAQSPSSLICPSPTSISPCTCNKFIGYTPSISTGIKIACAGNNLNDLQMSSILNAFLAPGLSPVQEISAPFNLLTKVPKQISKFSALSVVDLRSNRIAEISFDNGKPFLTNGFKDARIQISLGSNQIRDIPSSAFHLPSANYVNINLTDNKIAFVPSGAFRFASASVVEIALESNQISVFPDDILNYPSAEFVIISFAKNQIKMIPSAAVFNFPLAISVTINLSVNKIASIQRGAFTFVTGNPIKSVNFNLSNNSMTTIPCGTFNYPLISEVIDIKLGYNQITTVPFCSFYFPSAKFVFLELSNNLITTVSPGVFNFPSTRLMSIYLSSNQISVIHPNTFIQGAGFYIELKNNQLKRFESAVFKSLLNKSDMFSGIIIAENPIDCSSDPCHLAWLFKSVNSSQLKRLVTAYGVCSDSTYGSSFANLDSFDFNKNCPCSYC